MRLAAVALLAVAVLLPGRAPAVEIPNVPDCPATKQMCVQAERSGGIDLNTGVANLEGNVTGVMRTRDLTFRSDLLKAYRDESGEWRRLVLDGNVVLQQPAQEVQADHAQVTRERSVLFGNVRIIRPNVDVDANRVVLEDSPRRTILEGTADEPVQARFINAAETLNEPAARADAASTTAASGATGGTAEAAANGDTPATAEELPPDADVTYITTARAVLVEEENRVDLTGEVEIRQTARDLTMTAAQVSLFLGESNELEGFRAEGDVVVVQPDRRMTANIAQSQDRMETILLIGDAVVRQMGQFDLNAERVEVFTSAERGLVNSGGRDQPITLTMDLGAGNPYALDQARFAELADEGLPQATLSRLEPLQGRSFSSRSAFVAAVEEQLTPAESEQYLDLILANAR